MPPEAASVEAEIAAELRVAELAERLQQGTYRKMNWGEFKARVEANGVSDADPIFMIEVHSPDSDEPLKVVLDKRRSQLRGVQVTMEY